MEEMDLMALLIQVVEVEEHQAMPEMEAKEVLEQ
jgi:hypothetical protein